MNNTNRAANRTLLLLIGLVFLIVGGAAVTVIAWPAAADAWSTGAEASREWIAQAQAATAIEGGSLTWFTLGVLAALLVIVVLLIVVLIRSVSGRRSRAALRGSGAQNPLGRVTVTESFVSDALTHALERRDDILTTSVTANDVRREPVVHVNVTPRQNTSPREVTEFVDQLVTNLATLTGQDVPTYISIHSGLRARLAHDQRRLS